MQHSSTLLRTLPAEVLEDPRPGDAWERCALAQASDRALVEAVAEAIAPPKLTPSSSFVLHAPMELVARARLLSLAPPAARAKGRRRIAQIATRYALSGPEIGPTRRSYADQATALTALTAAISDGDAAEADGALAWLLARSTCPALIAGMADVVIPALGAAAHAPILLAMFLRSPAMGQAYGALLRAPVRFLALQGAARLTWPSNAPLSSGTAGGDLADALLSPPHVDSPSLFIAPTMLAVEAGGFAERLLAAPTHDLPLEDAERALLRIAAWSMLQDGPRHAPYGWTHCLTMPQGVLTLALVAKNRRAAIRVAATHVLGFRATLGTAELDPGRLPRRPTGAGPAQTDAAEAASIAFHAPTEGIGALRTALVGRAVVHGDAHLAKYTLACLDAAARDPEAAPLYLAGAAYLGAWWEDNPDTGLED
jgi:hypothetical protein